jgi:hypothetical protein
MSLSAAKNLFYKDYAVKTLELKGDYEIWVRDIEEYFTVSGLPGHFAAIIDYTEPDVNADLPDGEELKDEPQRIDKKARHAIIMTQARYSIYKSLGDSIKREIAKERFNTTNVLDLWRAVRSCFYIQDESTVQQLRDVITHWDIEKAGSWSAFVEGLERLYVRLDVVAGERSYTPSDKLHKLRSTLSKMEGEKEKNIFNQSELLVDQAKKKFENCMTNVLNSQTSE